MEEIKIIDGLWMIKESNGYKVGLTADTQEELGEITFIRLPKIGQKLNQGDSLIELEAEKAVSEFGSPICGEVLLINEQAEKNPALLNVENQLEAWIAIIKDFS